MNEPDQPGTETPTPGRSLKRRLLRGGAWVGMGKVLTAASTLAISSLLGKLLPRDTVGVYFLADRLIWLISMLALLGTNAAVVRVVAEALGTGRRDRARGGVRLVFRLALGGLAVVVGSLLLGGGAWLAESVYRSATLAGVIAIVAVWAALHSLQILTSETFRGFQSLGLATLFGGVITGTLAASVLFVSWLGGWTVTLRGVLLLFVISAAISLVLALTVLRRKVAALGPAERFPPRELLAISVPLWINGFLAWGLTQSDVLILGMFRPAAEVAVYGAAAKLVSLVLMSLMLVNLVVPPFVAELYGRGDRARLQRMLRLTASLAGIPAAVVLAAYLLFGGPLLQWVYTPDYRGGATVLAILALGRLVHVCSGSAAITLSMTGNQGALLRITLTTSVLTIAACLIVVEPFGATGVALAVASGVIVQNVSAWWTARQRTGLWTHPGLPTSDEVREFCTEVRRSR